MNEKRDGFMFYRSWWIAIANLQRDVQGDVLTAIIEYGLDGVTTGQLKPIAKAMLEMVRPIIDANYKRWENGCKGKEYGKLGGAPRGNKNAKKQPQDNGETTPNLSKTTPKQPQNNPLIINKKEKDIIKDFPNVKSSSVGEATDADEPKKTEAEIDFGQLAAFFNKTMLEEKSPIPKVQKMTERRISMVRARCREYGKSAIVQVIQTASKSSFLNGGGNQGFIATFDWIFAPNNFPKILEGNYNNKNENANQSTNQPNRAQSGGLRSKLPPEPACGLIED